MIGVSETSNLRPEALSPAHRSDNHLRWQRTAMIAVLSVESIPMVFVVVIVANELGDLIYKVRKSSPFEAM